MSVSLLARGAQLTGLWDATVMVEGQEVPFRMELSQNGKQAQGTFFDGDLRYLSDTGSFENGKLHLHWVIYNANLDAYLKDGKLEGNYVTRRSNTRLLTKPFRAKPFVPVDAAGLPPRSLAGPWILRADDKDPKHVWTMVIRQSGAEISGAIQRLDGDSGTLTGTVQGDRLVMSHFAGIRPAVLRGSITPSGQLDVTLDGTMRLTGLRSPEARAKGIEAPDPSRFTSVKNPSEPFRFRFPDLSGKEVSASDDRFRGKVLIVNITGSWCPNCNDDAPFLESLYRKYHAAGLEIVGLSFESGDRDYDKLRVREFIDRHGITYPILLAGKTDDVTLSLPFVVNFVGFPTTFFLGRDGRIKSVHDGFASVSTGDAHAKLKQETEALVRRLLEEEPPGQQSGLE